MLFSENTLGKNFTVFDEKTFEKRGEFSLGDDILPDDICGSPDGKIIYVNGAYMPTALTGSNGGASRAKLLAEYDGKERAPEDGADSRIHLMASDRSVFAAFDATTFEELWRTEIYGHVGHLVISPDGRYVFNALFDRYFTARVDTRTREVHYIPMTFSGGHGMGISPDGKKLYVGSITMAELAVVDVETDSVRQRVLFRDNVRPFAVTRDGTRAYVQNSFFHGFHVVDMEANRILRSIALPPLPPGTPVISAFPHTVDHGMILTPDESRLVALASTGNYLAVYSAPDLDHLGSVPVGIEPSWVICDSKGEFAYCSNRVSDDISVVSIPELREVRRFHAGHYPQRMWLIE